MAYQTKMSKYTAKNNAEKYGIDFDKNVFTLKSHELSYLLELAKKVGYRKTSSSRNDLSRASSFFLYLKKV
jgi:hypothetical protein